MSLHDLKTATKIIEDDPPFYALIMAAMLKADSDNIRLLRNAWPQLWAELDTRYHTPGGVLPGEKTAEEP